MKKESPRPSRKPRLDSYAKYSGMAFQMIAPIIIGVFGGIKLDEFLDLEFPVSTIILSLLGVTTAVYLVIRSVLNDKQ